MILAVFDRDRRMDVGSSKRGYQLQYILHGGQVAILIGSISSTFSSAQTTESSSHRIFSLRLLGQTTSTHIS